MGYFDYEFPQHKNIGDRIANATMASQCLTFFSSCDAVVTDDWENSFNSSFGAWPDQAFLIDAESSTLLVRGQFSNTNRGFRDASFSEQIESYLMK
jgi:hypothetical protein